MFSSVTLRSIIEFWFGGVPSQNYNKKWFPSLKQRDTIDAEIASKYSEILKQAQQGLLLPITKTPMDYLAVIIILDQFSRHIYRNTNREQINKNTMMALELTKVVLNNGWHINSQYNDQHFVFLLMPLRHIESEENYAILEEQTKLRQEQIEFNSKLVEKFKKTTITKKEHYQYGKKISDNSEILEHLPFTSDESNLNNHVIYKTMVKFYSDVLKIRNGLGIVSLSGGVDSMVICKVLVSMRNNGLLSKVMAIHINYNNRADTSIAEANFLKEWCNNLKIEFVLVDITDIKRGITRRDDYERKTREIRFSTYREVCSKFEHTNKVGIMLGHHIGDIQENVISNTMKGKDLLNLGGMSIISNQDGVTIYRPFLKNPKSQILDFAHCYGVPYFKDTTPEWSNRGKMRNKLIPLLQDIYGQGVLNTLSKLAFEPSLGVLSLNLCIEILKNRIFSYSNALSFYCELIPNDMLFLIEHVITEMFYRYGFNKTSAKTIQRLIEDIKAKKDKWISLSNKAHLLLYQNSIYLFDKANFHDEHISIDVEIGKQYTIGCWKITIGYQDYSSNSYHRPMLYKPEKDPEIGHYNPPKVCKDKFMMYFKTNCKLKIDTNTNFKLPGTISSFGKPISANGFPMVCEVKGTFFDDVHPTAGYNKFYAKYESTRAI